MSPTSRYGLAILLFLAPAARAQDAPEQLLPAGTQVYFRWDGLDAHRQAYARTALGRIMEGDTGTTHVQHSPRPQAETRAEPQRFP